MEFLKIIISSLQNYFLSNWLNICLGLGIIILFKIFSPFFAYVIIKTFNLKEKKQEIKSHRFIQTIETTFSFKWHIHRTLNLTSINSYNSNYYKDI